MTMQYQTLLKKYLKLLFKIYLIKYNRVIFTWIGELNHMFHCLI